MSLLLFGDLPTWIIHYWQGNVNILMLDIAIVLQHKCAVSAEVTQLPLSVYGGRRKIVHGPLVHSVYLSEVSDNWVYYSLHWLPGAALAYTNESQVRNWFMCQASMQSLRRGSLPSTICWGNWWLGLFTEKWVMTYIYEGFCLLVC